MSYRDDLDGRDKRSTTDGLHMYNSEESPPGTGHVTEQETTETTNERVTEGKQIRKAKPGLLERARKSLLGDRTLGDKAKSGLASWRMEGGFSQVLSKVASPKALTALVMSTVLGVFSILGIFTSYRNDDVIRNDNPIQCEPGSLELPAVGEGGDNDIQETVNIMYDIFVNQFGYSEYDLVGMVACMLVETGCDPDRLESDYVGILAAAKEQFDAVAGPGTSPDAATAKAAYRAYADTYVSAGMHSNSGYVGPDGSVCPGIGLIQWTAGRAYNFIAGLDKVSLNVSPMDVHYQCAYLIAEAMTSYQAWAPGGERTGNTDSTTAVTNFFGTMVYGHMPDAGDSHLAERLARIDEAEGYVFSAAANSEFTMDAVTMVESLSEEGFSASVAQAQFVQLCVNDTFIVTSDIAKAAVSISFLERGDYEDVQGAYGSYRRAARSPNMINDWNYIEGINQDIDTLGEPYNGNPTYASARGVTSDPKSGWRFYDVDGAPGKLDLIACTEYYYFAHLIAFPKETGAGGNAGYFSSCDRGTATAVRIAGADDKFPAGNPMYQLMWAVGGAKQGAQHNENARGTQGAGFLWKFSGFMRGSDWYSASGSANISNGSVMISWSVRAANGLLNEAAAGGATDGGMLGVDGESDDVASPDNPDAEDPADISSDTGYAGKSDAVKWATLRWPMSTANTTRHIITYVGDATVQDFWGIDWLQQQWSLFDDADRLIRTDLTETVPEVMTKGLAFKAAYASKSSDQHMTFYKAEAMGAQEAEDVVAFEPAIGRLYEFNAKTGLPTFHSWEQIFVRLIHNSDDDAAARTASGLDLYEQTDPFQKDGYLDDDEAEEIDSLIEQYDNEDTYSNKYFFEDWNSLGAQGSIAVSGNTSDYAAVAPSSLIWYDDTRVLMGDEAWTHERGAVRSALWRYELVTDIEYRMNQFLRFGLASLMCSYPSEEDADTFQTGVEGNDTGHILGNVYRRYSRIPDEMDVSGRYYYYNTVVSNDMLQDLVQLYNQEKNSATNGTDYVTNGGKTERNFGPMYTLALGRVYDNDYGATSASGSWIDRRYGLTAFDIGYIQYKGIEGNRMGEADTDTITDALTHIITEPMHMFSAAQLSLYDNRVSAVGAAVDGAHESQHLYNDMGDSSIQPYETEIYGLNPFLMLESSKLLNIGDEISAGVENWSAAQKDGVSVRNSVANGGVDVTSSDQDDRLSFIDRHYFVTRNGTVGTYAYQVLGLYPSTGSKTTASSYDGDLRAVKTLEAGHAGQADADNLLGSKGLVQYSDFIYADNATDNARMAQRLFGKDDRNGDGERDDYNRRDFILIPYYHTHAQQCDHSDLRGYEHYDLLCRWQNNTVNPTVADNLTLVSAAMIDTQVALNGTDFTYQGSRQGEYSCNHLYDAEHDYGDTISFDTVNVKNRGKYDLDQLLADIEDQEIRYFADNGYEIGWDDKPITHVQCAGWFEYGPCFGSHSGCGCFICGCGGGAHCSTWYCHACGEEKMCYEYCYHSCEDCLTLGYCHDHKECDDYGNLVYGANPSTTPCTCIPSGAPAAFTRAGGDPTTPHHGDGGLVDFKFTINGRTYSQSDKCHYEYGCNALEYLYHNDGQDGPRYHYIDNDEQYDGVWRLDSWTINVGTKSVDFTMNTVYPVNNLYMAIPVAPGVDMADFHIEDYMIGAIGQSNAVIPDKCNLVQQVTYDANGWVDNNWQDMINAATEGSLLNPYTENPEYINAVRSGIRAQEVNNDSLIPIGYESRDNASKGLLQYFTIEGDSIHREEDWTSYLEAVYAKYGSAQSEYIMDSQFNGTPDDLVALESIRNRVGYGKENNQKLSSSLLVGISQKKPPTAEGSSVQSIQYANDYKSSTEGVDAAALGIESYGWGEVAVVGTQHPKSPADAATNYGSYDMRYSNSNSNVSGPDGSIGNHLFEFGPSLLREIIGDEHVVHVKFDTQDYEGLTAQDAGDNGRDFMFYVDKQMAAYELGIDESDLVPKDYQSEDSDYYASHLDDFKDKDSTDGGANKYGVFKKMDMDTLYINFYTGELTDKMYAERVYPHKSTDERRSEGASEDNMQNPLAIAVESEPDGAVNGSDAMQTITTYKEAGYVDGADGNGQANTGDYRNWVTHASRGHRGMMTQYLNFATFFKDVYKAGDASNQDANYAYMIFENVMRTDIKISEDGGTDAYGYPMGSNDADAAHDRVPTSKEESFVYEQPPSDAVRQLGIGVGSADSSVSWGYGDSAGFSDTYGQGSNSHWKNMIDLYNAAMSVTREYGY